MKTYSRLPKKKSKWEIVLLDFLNSFGMVIITLVLVGVFLKYNQQFLSLENLKNICEQNAALSIVSIGITFLVISGNMDLSPGGVLALTSIVIASVFKFTGSIALAIFVGLLTSTLIGVFNGLIITKLDINVVIVTLSAMIWSKGLALAISDAKSILVMNDLVSFINKWSIGGISIPILVIIVAYIMGYILLKKTKLGRYAYAMGGGEMQTKQAGINIVKYKTLLFTLSGICVGLASTISVFRLGSANPIMGNGLELDAIVAVVIGGNRLSGGEGSFSKTIKGVVFLAVLGNGLNNLGVTDDVYYLIKGIIILLALTLEVTTASVKKRYAKSLKTLS